MRERSRATSAVLAVSEAADLSRSSGISRSISSSRRIILLEDKSFMELVCNRQGRLGLHIPNDGGTARCGSKW